MNFKLTALVAGMALVLSSAAHSESFFEIEAGIGLTNFNTVNGRWYQENMPADQVTRDAPEFSLGLTGPIMSRGKWGVDWHADYVNLGRASASCYCTPIDGNYDFANKRLSNKYDVDDAYFTGSGRAQGVAFTAEPYYWFHGVRLGAEAGAYVYRGSWDEWVGGWSQNMTMQKENFSLSESSWGVAPVAGVSIGDGVWTLSYRHYFMRHHSESLSVPPVWNDANVIELKVRF